MVLDYRSYSSVNWPIYPEASIGKTLIAASTQKDKNIALFGLGGSGLATALSLKVGGANLYCFDDNPASVQKAEELGLVTKDLRELNFLKLTLKGRKVFGEKFDFLSKNFILARTSFLSFFIGLQT